MHRTIKSTLAFAAAVLGLIFMVGIERFAAMRLSLPQLDGRMSVSGLSGPVEIRRAAAGVPHIYGNTQEDVFYGLGAVHAQDRLWQMEFTRRTAEGRLSEILGASAVSLDEFFRTLNFRRHAKASYEKLSPGSRKLFQAYADGVNAVMESTKWGWPPEFIILFHRPEPWTAVDSLLVGKMMSLELSTNMFQEIRRLRLLERLTPEQMLQFFPAHPNGDPAALSRLKTLLGASANDALPDDMSFEPVKGASNNWVVDGTRSASGKPLLANDPHLELTAPSIWYLAHLSLPSGNVVGATIAGIPAVVVGRNDRIAWGFTNTGADTQDLYLERLNPDDPSEYGTPEGFAPFRTREEKIRVRFGADVTLSVRETRRGPVLPPSWSGFARTPEDYALSLRWTALDDNDLTAEALLHFMTAGNWSEFIEAAKRFHQPMQNILYADVDGNTGFIAPGRIPIRKPENDLRGLFPAPGWDAKYDWDGYIPFEDLPQILNPQSRMIVTANNKIVPSGYPYLIAAEWEPGLRARRIETELMRSDLHDGETFKTLQADDVSPLFLDLRPALEKAKPRSEAGLAALDLLRSWNGSMTPDDARPLIFAGWYRELTKQLYADELGPLFPVNWSFKPVFVKQALDQIDGRGMWCDDITTESVESCRQILSTSLDAGMGRLQKTYGADLEAWTWGEAHVAVHAHKPFDNVPLLNGVFNIETPSAGGFYTINRGGYFFASRRPFTNIHGSGYRAIYDLADLDRSLFIQSTGQSGNPFSKYYDNLAERWARVDYLNMTTNRAAVEQDTVARLELVPAARFEITSE